MKKTFGLCVFYSFCLTAMAAALDTNAVSRLEKEGRYAEALALCESADESAAALCMQGEYYLHGRKGVAVDKNRGRQCFRRAMEILKPAAESGDAPAQYQFALCHEYGVDDLKTAREWYIKAADAGNAKAMFKAGWFAARRLGADGMEVAEARDLALRYAKAASDAGDGDGTALLAWLAYLDCKGRDFEKALPMLMKSVENNSPQGMTLLGRMYYDGRGVAKDLEKAELYLQRAVDLGYSEASATLDEIKKRKK